MFKNPTPEQDIKDICQHNGIQFACRSHGMATTATVPLSTIVKIVREVENRINANHTEIGRQDALINRG